jgi:hypothetical protein
MSTAPILTQAALRELLSYDPETGAFTWKRRPNARASWNTRYAGKEAGYEWSPEGKVTYRAIRIFDWPFMAHRLAVIYMTGEFLQADVDHEDGDGLNNRWSNLRPATKPQNGANRGPNRNSKTGIKGVSLYKGRYRASFRGKQLGLCGTAEEAAALYEQAAKEHFGQFARVA